jgi:dUTPase
MIDINYKKLRDNAVIPYAATKMSGGLDLTAAHIEYVSDNEVIVYLGLAMQPPPGYMIRFSPRSSFTGFDWILNNSPTLGDADFLDEYRLRFRAIPTSVKKSRWKVLWEYYDLIYPEFPYKVGDRVAQMWVEPILKLNFIEKELVNKTDRKGGFGSTNKK